MGRASRCVRDYIHVMDLAEGHVAALDKLFSSPDIGCVPINLGTGTGTTVLEMVKVSARPGSSCDTGRSGEYFGTGTPLKPSTETQPTHANWLRAHQPRHRHRHHRARDGQSEHFGHGARAPLVWRFQVVPGTRMGQKRCLSNSGWLACWTMLWLQMISKRGKGVMAPCANRCEGASPTAREHAYKLHQAQQTRQ